ncbi:unnamed protein product [Cylicostephanus goldi]|uniref:Uncharacterized protein n=1 Tax=Cylicostephanus goldi TaxID=71465 RepID=A0A3P6T8R5_CYLGO|nr:unnamed protein product [Cylicostephanus goldi]
MWTYRRLSLMGSFGLVLIVFEHPVSLHFQTTINWINSRACSPEKKTFVVTAKRGTCREYQLNQHVDTPLQELRVSECSAAIGGLTFDCDYTLEIVEEENKKVCILLILHFEVYNRWVRTHECKQKYGPWKFFELRLGLAIDCLNILLSCVVENHSVSIEPHFSIFVNLCGRNGIREMFQPTQYSHSDGDQHILLNQVL